jgi:CxxC-x17-CxxC domain-containing protein
MGNFNRPFNRDSRSSGGGRSFDRGSRDREMHQATCSNCGKDCQVPFKPNGSKPVFCSDCFEKNGGEQRRSNDRDYAAPRRSNFEDRRPSFNENRSYDRPQNFDRPREDARPQQNNNDQFAALNSKLDRIITLLTSKPAAENTSAEFQSEKLAPVAEKKPRSPRKPKAVPAEVAE